MVSWAGLRRHRQPRLDLAQFTSLSNPSGLSSVSTASLWWGAARAPSRVTTWCELREQGWQRCAKVSTATGGPLLQSPSPFPPCAKPPPLHCINILGDKWLPQPICFFVQICSQFGNMIYKYCLCSQGLTLMYVRPDGWMPCWPQIDLIEIKVPFIFGKPLTLISSNNIKGLQPVGMTCSAWFSTSF